MEEYSNRATDSTPQQEERRRARYSGILLHPTSLPGRYGIGDLGQGAYDFVDFLERAGQSLWQILPLGPTGYGNSPYQPYSVFAGQPLLISPSLLIRDGLISEETVREAMQGLEFSEYYTEYDNVILFKNRIFQAAYEEFCRNRAGFGDLAGEYRDFCEKENSWLPDYALYMTLKVQHEGLPWTKWELRYRDASRAERGALAAQYADSIGYYSFVQFLFFRQWADVKNYANGKGIRIVGDIPIFVSPDGADIWSDRALFQTDEKGYPSGVAGVPPDYFCEDGQLWGNPLYDWDYHRKTGYAWWIARIRKQLELTDFLRIDHFRGFESYWSVPAGSLTAQTGHWVKGPGEDFFYALEKELGEELPLFAEDLGIITPAVEALRDQFGFPGMKVLQFAFEGEDESTYLPYLYDENCICYTGTHDNDTSLGWFLSTAEKNRERVRKYMRCPDAGIHWEFIRTAVSSVAKYAIFPMQDALGYGGDCRMNRPGIPSGNWMWRCTPQALDPGLADALRELCETYGRDRKRLERSCV